MWTLAVVVDPPLLDLDARTSERRETRLGKALIAEEAIEGLDMRVLGRFAGLNEIECYTSAGSGAFPSNSA